MAATAKTMPRATRVACVVLLLGVLLPRSGLADEQGAGDACFKMRSWGPVLGQGRDTGWGGLPAGQALLAFYNAIDNFHAATAGLPGTDWPPDLETEPCGSPPWKGLTCNAAGLVTNL